MSKVYGNVENIENVIKFCRLHPKRKKQKQKKKKKKKNEAKRQFLYLIMSDLI